MLLKIKKILQELEQNSYLEAVLNKLTRIYNIKIEIGVEIEFYCKNLSDQHFQILYSNFPKYKFKREKGEFQFEYEIAHNSDLNYIIEEITNSKINIAAFLGQYNYEVDYSPKKYKNSHGNAMNFHISLTNICDEYVHEIPNLEQILSLYCNFIEESFIYYVHYEEDFERFDHKFQAPTNISFGFNNRTCALRIINRKNFHFENRIPSVISDPYLVITTIICTLDKILDHLINGKLLDKKYLQNISEIYGNSFDEQYNVKMFPKNLNEAIKSCNYKFFLL